MPRLEVKPNPLVCVTIMLTMRNHCAFHTEEEIQPLLGDAQRDAGITMIGEMVAGFFGLRLSVQ